MAFPKTKEQLVALGYKMQRQSVCRGPKCARMIEWWLTPRGKNMPLDPDTCQPHWTTCPDMESFRRANELPQRGKK